MLRVSTASKSFLCAGRKRLEGLCTGGGRERPRRLTAQILRERDRLELLLVQIQAAVAKRDDEPAPIRQDAQPRAMIADAHKGITAAVTTAPGAMAAGPRFPHAPAPPGLSVLKHGRS